MRSLGFACWLDAAAHGQTSIEAAAARIRGGDPVHLVLGLADRPLQLPDALTTLVRAGGLGRISLALPVPGDPAGLAGPPRFNSAALEAGSAVVLAGRGLGLVPGEDARVVFWQAQPAEAPAVLDPGEARTTLRATLTAVTRRLVELDVTSWSPEIPDLLMNLRHRDPVPLPPGYDPRTIEAIEQAVLCREIVALASYDESGAASAYELEQRRLAVSELDRAARRVLVACAASGHPGEPPDNLAR